jgi:hypothetical protein
MAAFGLWNSEELDDIAAELTANRARQSGRSQILGLQLDDRLL